MNGPAAVEIIRFDHRHHAHLLPGYVSLYQRVYAQAPWNEYLMCSRHRHDHPAVGLTEAADPESVACAICGAPLMVYWPADEVRSDIEGDLRHPHASLHLAVTGQQVVGLAVGYALPLGQMDRKLRLPGTTAALKTFFGTQSDEMEVAYFSDIAVDPAFRRNHIARRLFLDRLRVFAEARVWYGVTRTKGDPEPSVTYKWYTSDGMGFTVVNRYDDDRGRVVLAKRIIDLFCLLGGPYVPPEEGK